MGLLSSAAAIAATARGKLSSTNVGVGEDVYFEVQVDETPDHAPVIPKVDGLEFNSAGLNSQTLLSGGRVTHQSSYRFVVTPQRPGEFTIPAIEVEANGEKLRTRPVTLKVTQPEKKAGAGDFAYGEVRVQRKTVYVGEEVPIELHYFLEGGARWSMNQAPMVDGEGYTTRRMGRPEQSRAVAAGKEYNHLVFPTILTPNRAGKITLGPVPFRLSYSKQLGQPRDFLGNTEAKTLSVIAPALELEVKPLPVDGRPKDFAGAIGNFKFSAKGSPDHIKIGDPVAMELRVEGTGNFDRVSAPTLAQPEGWRAYPANDRFDAADESQSSGVKTFQIPVVPEGKKTTMPVFNFSYFDPEKAKYVTLTSTATPLVVEGAPPPAVVASPAPEASKPAAAPPDILGLRAVPGFWGAGWNPPAAVWFGVMFAPAPLIVGLLFWRARRSDPRLAERAALRREKAARLARIRATSDRGELFDAAAHVLQLDIALATDQPPASVDEAAVLVRSDTPGIREIFAERAALVYAGGGAHAVSATERDRVLLVLEQFGRGIK
jgi:hypothetical protein